MHAPQQPWTQRYVPWFLQKDAGPCRLVLCVDHEAGIPCLPLDFFQVPMIPSTEEMQLPTIQQTLHQNKMDNHLSHIQPTREMSLGGSLMHI